MELLVAERNSIRNSIRKQQRCALRSFFLFARRVDMIYLGRFFIPIRCADNGRPLTTQPRRSGRHTFFTGRTQQPVMFLQKQAPTVSYGAQKQLLEGGSMEGSKDTAIHFAVTIIGKDCPGIVAGAAEVLYRLGCNIEDSSSTMLGGEFAMILIVSHIRPFSKTRLLEDFKSFGEEMQLSVFVRTLSKDEIRYEIPSGEICMVSVYGSDQPGIVYRVTKELAARKINISDMNTRLIGTPEEPLYVLMLEAVLPEGIAVEDVSLLLENLKKELKVEIGVRSITPISL
jgi:glycine cleavage system transcriptional repressor